MDVRLSAEQQALRDSVARVVDRYGPDTVRSLDDTERRAGLDAAVDASGWRDLRLPTGGGAPQASGVEAAVVAEELGRGLADTAFLGPTLAAELRRLAGAPPAATVETVVLTATLSAPAVMDPGLPRGAVAPDARGATGALVLVPAPGGAGHGLASVALDPAGPGTDLTRPGAAVAAGHTVPEEVPSAHRLTDDDLSQWTALGLALDCADLVGVMRGAVDLAVGYASERRQFDRPIGSFQAVQHLLADAYTTMEGSRSVALHAAWSVDAQEPREALVAAAVAKAYCARAARTACETAVQVHGGIGNTWECLAHVFLRRALLSVDLLGGVGPSLDRVVAHHGIGGDRGLR
jgi:alkylation response protein AidB-like acyl-CoA dehydrogenase